MREEERDANESFVAFGSRWYWFVKKVSNPGIGVEEEVVVRRSKRRMMMADPPLKWWCVIGKMELRGVSEKEIEKTKTRSVCQIGGREFRDFTPKLHFLKSFSIYIHFSRN